ncbi:MAG TPA: ABC transporter permease subunit, partial [Solirubrobacterales bacterium]
LAMRLIAEERRNQTMVMLISAPLSMTDIVLGKFLGLIAFLAMIVMPLFVVRSVLRSDHPLRGPPALAAGAGCLAFGVASALYDILTFPQAPYLFLFMAAMCVCAASVEVPEEEVERGPEPLAATS